METRPALARPRPPAAAAVSPGDAGRDTGRAPGARGLRGAVRTQRPGDVAPSWGRHRGRSQACGLRGEARGLRPTWAPTVEGRSRRPGELGRADPLAASHLPRPHPLPPGGAAAVPGWPLQKRWAGQGRAGRGPGWGRGPGGGGAAGGGAREGRGGRWTGVPPERGSFGGPGVLGGQQRCLIPTWRRQRDPTGYPTFPGPGGPGALDLPLPAPKPPQGFLQRQGGQKSQDNPKLGRGARRVEANLTFPSHPQYSHSRGAASGPGCQLPPPPGPTV